MAANLECEIFKGEPPLIPENPTPWQVQMRWFDMVDDGTGALNRQEIRTWTVDAPSELVAKTIKIAFDGVTDSDFGTLTFSGFQV